MVEKDWENREKQSEGEVLLVVLRLGEVRLHPQGNRPVAAKPPTNAQSTKVERGRGRRDKDLASPEVIRGGRIKTRDLAHSRRRTLEVEPDVC